MGNAAKVGAIFVVFVVLLVATYAALGQRLFAGGRAEYKITFADADGITPGTKVLLAGVQVGLVRKVELLSPTLAQATFLAEPKVQIPEGTRAQLPTALVGIGETRIDLIPPPNSVRRPLLTAGATIPGGKAGPLDAFLPDAKEQLGATLRETTALIRATRKLLEDPVFTNRTKSLLNDTNVVVREVGQIAGRVDSLLVRNDARINNAAAALTSTVRNIERTTGELARFAESGQLQGDVKGLFRELQTTTAQARGLLVEFQGLASDPNLKRTIGNVADASGSGATIAKTSEETARSAATIAKTSEETARSAANIAKTGEGIAADGKAISAKLIDLTERANIVADRTIRLQAQVSGILARLPGGRPPAEPGAPPTPGATEPERTFGTRVDLLNESEPDHVRTDLYLDVPLGPNTVSIGLYDAFESNRLIAQLGRPFGDGQLRYGIFAGKPGVGVDYPLGSALSFRGDAWGFNDPRLDLRFRVRLREGFYGWAGADRVFRDNAPTFGIGLAF